MADFNYNDIKEEVHKKDNYAPTRAKFSAKTNEAIRKAGEATDVIKTFVENTVSNEKVKEKINTVLDTITILAVPNRTEAKKEDEGRAIQLPETLAKNFIPNAFGKMLSSDAPSFLKETVEELVKEVASDLVEEPMDKETEEPSFDDVSLNVEPEKEEVNSDFFETVFNTSDAHAKEAIKSDEEVTMEEPQISFDAADFSKFFTETPAENEAENEYNIPTVGNHDTYNTYSNDFSSVNTTEGPTGYTNNDANKEVVDYIVGLSTQINEYPNKLQNFNNSIQQLSDREKWLEEELNKVRADKEQKINEREMETQKYNALVNSWNQINALTGEGAIQTPTTESYKGR